MFSEYQIAMNNLTSFTDILDDEIENSQPISLPSSISSIEPAICGGPLVNNPNVNRPAKGTGQYGQFRNVEEIDAKYRSVFTHSFFNVVQSRVIDDALYSDKSLVICAPTGSGKTVIFEMAIVQLLMYLDDKKYTGDFKIVYMAPVKALCTERLSEWYPKFTKLGLLCIEVTGDTDVDFSQLKPYRIIITTPEKWDMLTRRWRDHKALVEVIKLFLIDEVHILNDETRGPVLEAVVSRMKTIESSVQSNHRTEQLQKQCQGTIEGGEDPPRIRFVAVSATVSNPEDVASWLGAADRPAAFYKFGDECRPVKVKRVVEGYPCAEGTSIFKFDIILNYKLWPIIQKYHDGKPTLIFCNTRKSVVLTAEALSKELTINFNPEQKARLVALASTTKNKKLQSLILSGVGCHHAGLLFEERTNIEHAFRNRYLPILITTTTLAMGVNLPAHLVIIKNTQQYVNGAYQEYSISTVLQMVGRAGRPQFDTEATAVIMTRLADKYRYEALVGGNEPLQSFLHKRLAENLNSEAALGTVGDVAQCVQWLRSTFLFVRSAREPRRYLGLPPTAPQSLITKKIEELCVKAMNGLATAGLITMDEASCIESTDAGRLMSIYYLDLETMKNIMKIDGTETLERLLTTVCESHEMSDMHLRVDERRCLNALNRNNTATTIRFPMKGKISTRQMKLNCIIQAVLGCLPITDPSLNQEAMKVMRVAERICKCLVAYVTRPDLVAQHPQYFSAILNSIILAKCVTAHLWENSPFVSKQLKGIGPTFSALLATAGKVNFMLLEESHPRDLERIMNKGPPTGNTLRKQISLLPKYQLTFTPINERTISLQLVLQNVSFLSENLEYLTAGETHKSYIIVGDSDNYLLLLTSIKDKDLISFYDGSITYEITRKRNCEHKIFAHCISSNFVGIDAQCEFSFKDLETPYFERMENISKKMHHKQTCITDVFKQRKRKNFNSDNTPQLTKRKRDNPVIEKFNELKEPFNETFDMLNKSIGGVKISTKSSTNTLISNNSLHETSANSSNKFAYTQNNDVTKLINEIDIIDLSMPDINVENSDEYIDDEQIHNLLNNIEHEIAQDHKVQNIKGSPTKQTATTINLDNNNPIKGASNCTTQFNLDKTKTDNQMGKILSDLQIHRDIKAKRRKPTNIKSNYNFIELLEKSDKLTDDDANSGNTHKTSGFSNAIKTKIDQYIMAIQCAPILTCNKYIHQLATGTEINNLPNEDVLRKCISPIPHRVSTSPTSDIEPHRYCKGVSQDKKNTEIATYDKITDTKETSSSLGNKYHNINSPQMKNNKLDNTLSQDLKIIESMHKKSHNSDCNEETEFNRGIINPETMNMLNAHDGINNCNNYLEMNNIQAISCRTIDNKYNLKTKSDKATSEPILNKNHSDVKNYACVTNVVSKYSFNTTTVSVKSTIDSLVPVIQNLNVSVGITKTITINEIISKCYTSIDGTNDFDNSNKKPNISEPVPSPLNMISKGPSRTNPSMITKNYKDIIHSGLIKSKPSKIEIANSSDIMMPKMITNDNQKHGQVAISSDIEIKETSCHKRCIKHMETINEETILNNNINSKSDGIIGMDFNDVDNTKYCNTSIKPNNSFHGGNKITDILQKYSTLLRQNEECSNLVGCVSTIQNSASRQPMKTLNKPFKIRDIQHFNITLPETLVCNASRNFDNVQTNSNSPILKINRGEDVNQIVCDDLLYSKQSEIDKQIDIIKDEEFQDCNDQLPWLPCVNYPLTDFKIYESMFDPKALLQCLETDKIDKIIPPPPQFCDNFFAKEIFSPNQSSADVQHVSENSQFGFSDFGSPELISFKDMETQLSCQFSCDDYRYLDLNQTPNSTPIEQNVPKTFTIQDAEFSRRSKLNQFVLPPKKKMKI